MWTTCGEGQGVETGPWMWLQKPSFLARPLFTHLPKVLKVGGWKGPGPTLKFLQQGFALTLP